MIELLIIGACAGLLGYSVIHTVKKTNHHVDELEKTIESRHALSKEATFEHISDCRQLNQVVGKFGHQIEELQKDKNLLHDRVIELQNELDLLRFEIKRTNQSNL